MNIEEAINILTQKEDINLSNHFNNTRFFEAIYTLLKAYEKEKEKNKELNFKYQARKDRTKQEIEKLKEKDYDFIVGFTLFYPSGFKTKFRHFDNLRVAEMFAR